MTATTEAEIRAAHAAADAVYKAHPSKRRPDCHVHRRELLRLLDEARAERDELARMIDVLLRGITATSKATQAKVDHVRAERDGARDLAEQYRSQVKALEAALRQTGTECRDRNHAGLDRLIGARIENRVIVGPDKVSDGPQPWMGQDVAFLAMMAQEEMSALRAEAEANRRDAELWRAEQAEKLRMRMMQGDPRIGVSGGAMPDSLGAIPRNDAMKEPSRDD